MSLVLAAGISAGTSLLGGFLGSSSAKKAAKAQQAAAEAAAKRAAETQKTLAGNQNTFDKELADSRYVTGLKTLNLEVGGQKAALELEKKGLDQLLRSTTSSYALQSAYLRDVGGASIRDEVASSAERAELAVKSAFRDFEIRSNTVKKLMAARISGSTLAAEETYAQAEDAKSDTARKADQDIATLRVASGERGAATTNSYLRLLNEGQYYRGVDIGRIDRKAQAQVDALENDLVVAAVQAEADLQTAHGAMTDTVNQANQSLRETGRAASLKAKELQMQLEQLAAQQAFDLEALALEGEGSDLRMKQLQDNYDLARQTLTDELAFTNKQSDFVFDQTVIASDAQMDSNIALSMANRNAAISLANTSFMQGILSTGASLAGSYYSANLQAKANGLHGIDLFQEK